jgi:hypothetical protein
MRSGAEQTRPGDQNPVERLSDLASIPDGGRDTDAGPSRRTDVCPSCWLAGDKRYTTKWANETPQMGNIWLLALHVMHAILEKL